MATATQLSVFSELTPLKRIYTARRGNLRCCAIRLKDDSLCLFSPVAGLNAAARASLEEIGEVTFLLAPNHYHNKALAEHAAAFPKAKLCATRAATPRLKKQTNLSFIDLARVTAKLSRGYSFVEPVGLKTGEVWLRLRVGGSMTWMVVDAISGAKMTRTESRGATPSLLGTFPNFGIGDKVAYYRWFSQQLIEDAPECVVPCHGGILASASLPKKLAALMKKHFD